MQVSRVGKERTKKLLRKKNGKWSSWGKGSSSSSWASGKSSSKRAGLPSVKVVKVKEKPPALSKIIKMDGNYPSVHPRETEHEWNGHKYERWHDTMRRAEAESNAVNAAKKGYKVKITKSYDEGEWFWTVWRYLPAWG